MKIITTTALALAAITGLSAEVIEGTITESDTPTISAAADGTFEGRFRDVFDFEGEAGLAVTIDLRADFDCYLALVGPSGEVIATNDDQEINTHSRLEHALLDETGTHRVVATSYTNGITGSYTLEIGEPGPPPAPKEDVALEVPGEVAGGLRTDDDASLEIEHPKAAREFFRDGYALSGGEPGSQWVASLEGDLDMVLLILGPDGEIIAENDDAETMFNCRAEFTWQGGEGPHRVIVTSFQQRTNGDYTLKIETMD